MTWDDEQARPEQHQDEAQHHGEGQATSTAAQRLGGPSEARDGQLDREPRHDSDAVEGHSGTGRPTQAKEKEKEFAALIAPDRAEDYRKRWNQVKGDFVDEPRTAVRGANGLVGEVLDELEALFRKQRDDIEHGLDSEDTTTEDLRQALSNYRSFFDRLLSL